MPRGACLCPQRFAGYRTESFRQPAAGRQPTRGHPRPLGKTPRGANVRAAGRIWLVYGPGTRPSVHVCRGCFHAVRLHGDCRRKPGRSHRPILEMGPPIGVARPGNGSTTDAPVAEPAHGADDLGAPQPREARAARARANYRPRHRPRPLLTAQLRTRHRIVAGARRVRTAPRATQSPVSTASAQSVSPQICSRWVTSRRGRCSAGWESSRTA